MKIYLGKSFSPNFQTWLRLELEFMIGNAKKNVFVIIYVQNKEF